MPRIRYDTGNPEAPDDPFGRMVLILEPSGLVRLGNWHRGGVRAWSGSVALGVTDAVLEHLRDGGFPAGPRSITPSAVFTLTVESNPEQSLTDSVHSSNESYRSALKLLHGVIRQLSGDVLRVGPAPAETLVLNARSISIDEVR
ncbi:MAG TPA: hypothetical protein VFL29_07490 [Candidatus Dormibacteraeota bacterium]|nr:hypothetical protein [Candidatus Dormibacteraeota bacterium]